MTTMMAAQIDSQSRRFEAKLDALSQRLMDAIQQLQPIQQSNSTPPTPQPTPSPPLTSAAKKKRNQKTREQYKKKKAQAQRASIQVQEVEHLDIQSSGEAAVKCIQSGAAFSAGKHVFLQPWKVATSPQHAVISCVGMASFDGMILVQNGAICMPRMGVG